MQDSALHGLVLCGGKSSRFGSNKTWYVHQGEPLVGHAIEQLAPQVDRLWLSCRHSNPRLAALGYPIIVDLPQYDGPLGALYSAMLELHQLTDWLLTVPVDSLGMPCDLARNLRDVVATKTVPVALAATNGQPQYVLGLWSMNVLPLVGDTLKQGRRSMMAVLEQCGYAQLECPDLQNLNYPPEQG